MHKTLNILITSAGGLTGTFLIKHLLQHPIQGYKYRIVAMDSSEYVYAKHVVDSFYKVPASSDPNYANMVLSLVEQEQIEIIFPTTSYDTPFYSKHKAELLKKGVQLLVCDVNTHEILHHKQKMYLFMKNIGLPVPEIFETKEAVTYPAIIKKCESSGSKEVRKLEDRTDLDYWSVKMKDYVVTDYISGKEYTVDCLFDQKGLLIVCNQRERLKTLGGGAVICQNQHPLEIRDYIQAISKHIHLEGPVNFQYILNRHNQPFIIDFNTRFASGGLPLTIASGYDIPNLMIRLMLGDPIEEHIKYKKDQLTMYRYFQEYFTEEPS